MEKSSIENNKSFKPIFVQDEMSSSYLSYAMSVIVSRALPDVRDGLKPVHRRIIYAMYKGGYDWSKPFRKSARIVGDVIGKYHPHGDQSVYDALVRLVQDFSMSLPLISGQGNFGSIDGDPPAAMRYTETKLGKIAQYLTEDLEKNTVIYRNNYDETEKEPEVLPSQYPNILVNGAGGIAVGMATSIPPHNLGEIIDGTLALINNKDIKVKELMKHIPGPDFPTGGVIIGKKIILDAKVPFTAFEESTKIEDLNEVKRFHKKHAKETREHMDKLAKKSYWNQYEDAAPFVLMVLPAEALLYAAFQADDSLFKDGIDKQIYICSPLNLLATMQVIAQGHVHVKQNEDARKITTAARELLKVISIFNGHFKSIGMHTQRLFESFNKGAKTLEVKVKPKLEKLSDMGIELEKGKEVDPGIKMIEDGPIDIVEDEDIELSDD